MKAFVSWSGGKDGTMAFYKEKENFENYCFLNMIAENNEYSRSHGIKSIFLKAQADAIGVSIIQKATTWENYEETYKKALLELKEKEITHGIFGDIDVQPHRDWVERVCKEQNINPILPLWKEEREKLIKEFIDSGFKAIIVATQKEKLGKEWLGRKIDYNFITDIKTLDIDVCGENGEYHTFVYDGPIFKKPVEFKIGEKIEKDKNWFLEIIPA
ncbi:MAG: diphthine--ammonia ligase [bacterium]